MQLDSGLSMTRPASKGHDTFGNTLRAWLEMIIGWQTSHAELELELEQELRIKEITYGDYQLVYKSFR